MLIERPVYRSLNEPFTLFGYDLGQVVVCYFALYYGVALFGLIAGFVLCALAVAGMTYGKRKDPQFLAIIMRARPFRKHFDAGRGGERQSWFAGE